jgi:Prokaryotic N-terminal methylation motif
MHVLKANGNFATRGRKQDGFSVLEMIVASAILMVGIVSVVQLVPASLKNSVGNRMDTMATVIAQRELDQMLSQPLSVNSFRDDTYYGWPISLGGTGSPGAAVVMSGQSAIIDFSADAPPAGFYIPSYVDPNDQSGSSFELRWAVFQQPSNGPVVSRRIIIGCRRNRNVVGGQLFLPVTLDSSVQKGSVPR